MDSVTCIPIGSIQVFLMIRQVLFLESIFKYGSGGKMKKLSGIIIALVVIIAFIGIVRYSSNHNLPSEQSDKAVDYSLSHIYGPIDNDSSGYSGEIDSNYSGYSGPVYDFDYSWVDGQRYIAHAMGGIDNEKYTNSKEAFELNYQKGFKIFECDFDYIEGENIIFLSHGENEWRERFWMKDTPYNAENFLNTRFFGKYTTLSLSDFIQIMADYKDVYMILDTKRYDDEGVNFTYSEIINKAKETDPSILDRMIPQIYTEDMLKKVMELHPFKSMIFTLYQTSWSPESVAEFCSSSGIRFVTVVYYLVNEDMINFWHNHGIKVGVHTRNKEERAKELFDMGVDLIYTDFLEP